MKKMILVTGFLMLGTAQAEVYKCMDAAGKIKYQSTVCASGVVQKVPIETIDPNITAEAQAKLAEQQKKQEEQQAAEAEAARQERELQTREEIATEIRNQTEALNRSADALENRNLNQPPIYIAPGMFPPQPPINPVPPPPRAPQE